MLKRSQSLSLQIPTGAGEWIASLPCTPEPGLPQAFPDFQRVTISGDYCAGVKSSITLLLDLTVVDLN